MTSFILFSCGFLLLFFAIYLFVKGKELRSDPTAYKSQIKGVSIILLIGLFSIGGALVILQIDNGNNASEVPAQTETTESHWILTGTNVKSFDQEILETLLLTFQNHCKGWQQYPEAIESAEIKLSRWEKSDYEVYRQEDYGWYTEIELNIKIKDDAKLPTELRMVPGHTLYYFIGGGKKPGIEMLKDVSALFFGFKNGQFEKGKNTFVANDAYKIADEIVTEE